MNKGIITDGIVNKDVYDKTCPKILFVLRQGYVKEEDPELEEKLKENGYDLTKFLKGAVKGKYLFGHSWCTWYPIIYIANGILSGKTYKSLTDVKKIIDCLNHIAVINVIKTPGKISTTIKSLNTEYEKEKENLKKQIHKIKPDIIIFCGTAFLFLDDLKLNTIKKMTSKNWKGGDYWKYEVNINKLYIEIDHPSSFFYKKNNELRKEYINDIIDIYLKNKINILPCK